MSEVKVQTIQWSGYSGQKYRYWIYPIDTTFGDEPGNYIFAKESKPNHFVPLYIGQTSSFEDRMDDHHKMECAKRKGATYMHVHHNSSKEDRLAEERDLITKWDTPCNG